MEQHHLPADARAVTQSSRATPEEVWAVLADGFTFAAWVVGASHVRAVDAGWPAPGTLIHHSIGAWPFVVRDVTRVQECLSGQLLVLHASVRPFGEAAVALKVSPAGAGSRLRMSEAPTSDRIRRLVPEPVWGPLLRVRNQETLRRLSALAERRIDPGDAQPG